MKHPQFISDLVLATGSSNNSGVLQEQGMVRFVPYVEERGFSSSYHLLFVHSQ